MIDPKHEIIKKELEELCKKHGIRHGSFSGMDGDESYLGFLCLGDVFDGDRLKLTDGYETALCVGRLWQHARSAVREALHQFETGKGH